jgi:MFS family permease
MANRTRTLETENLQSWPSARRGWYATLVLLLAYTFSFIDRQVLNLLVEPIRADLQISDTQVSVLQGFAFVVTYILMSVPIGRLVDRFNRVLIMVGGVLFWSFATIACGLSNSYSQLMLARMGVGTGEAALTPAAWSVLADYFHPDKLSLPISVYLMGPYIGTGIALIAGAEVLDWTQNVESLSLPLIGEVSQWQFTFIAVGLPGLLITALVGTIREPQRKGRVTSSLEVPTLSTVWQYMLQHRNIYLALHLGVPAIVVMLYGLQAWVPTTLVRVFEWDLAHAGRVYGVIALIAGSSGVLTGPFVSRYFERRGAIEAPMRLAMFSSLAAATFIVGLAMQSNVNAALACIAAASFFVTFPLALVSTMIQKVTPNEMRGVVTGLYVVTGSVIGLTLGATLVALSTDYIFRDTNAVAKSLGLVALFAGPVAAILFGRGCSAYRQRHIELTSADG